RPSVSAPAMQNPLSLRTAIKFGLLYAIFAYLVTVGTQLDWERGLLPLSFISGLTDINAIALSMATAQRPDGGVNLGLAIDAVLIAAVANSIIKGLMAATLGTRALRVPVALVLGATAIVGTVAMLIW